MSRLILKVFLIFVISTCPLLSQDVPGQMPPQGQYVSPSQGMPQQPMVENPSPLPEIQPQYLEVEPQQTQEFQQYSQEVQQPQIPKKLQIQDPTQLQDSVQLQPSNQNPQSTDLSIVDQSQEIAKETVQPAKNFSPDIQKIVNKGELVVAMYGVDQPPFFMKDKEGNLIGFDVELANLMGEILGVKVRFNREAKSFNDVIDIVANGQADVGISKLSYTLARAKKVLYSKSYMTLKKTFLINRLKMAKAKGKREADTLEKLINHHEGTIGVISNSSYVNFAKQLFPKSTIVPLESWGLESLDIAMQGKVLAIFRDDLEILKLIRRVPDSNFHVLPVTLKEQIDPIHIILPWDKQHLLEWINGFLDATETNLSVDELLNRYETYFTWANQLDSDSKIQTKEIIPSDLKSKTSNPKGGKSS